MLDDDGQQHDDEAKSVPLVSSAAQTTHVRVWPAVISKVDGVEQVKLLGQQQAIWVCVCVRCMWGGGGGKMEYTVQRSRIQGSTVTSLELAPRLHPKGDVHAQRC